ncbi:hypothetical protein TRFO_36296 [Tritrichomonas foetus]|uniref:Spatacsin C-terminal domain-containing protein n=1 Tax=Tritrichomonas foetus TaxID=1144522 RepID=A0A1J4JEG6_9EUKA|nr:hypothetical protein TRFO_36296 [Tritrichomonas foetus]|eukprot:OHS97504.1 hypothetical protein TRFO_36296 [Tritrichomonas foetus]
MDGASSPKLTEEELLPFVLDALSKNRISDSYGRIRDSFPNYDPAYLFRTLVLQESWSLVRKTKINDAIKLIESLGESAGQHLREMWRQTTHSKTRQLLFDHLRRHQLLSQKDEELHQIIQKISQKYPNTSFSAAVASYNQTQNLGNNESNIDLNGELNTHLSVKPSVIQEALQSKELSGYFDVNDDSNDSRPMIFQSLFPKPSSPQSIPNTSNTSNLDNSKYFVGNVALLENQPINVIKLLKQQFSDSSQSGPLNSEYLWILHCEHKVSELARLFKEELNSTKFQKNSNELPESLIFINSHYNELNEYEKETLLDILCMAGFICAAELKDKTLIVQRLSKNKLLFDQSWFANKAKSISFETFFRKYAEYCGENELFMAFEMFVLAHQRAKDIDLSSDKTLSPMIRFIWDLWVKRDTSSAALSNMQFLVSNNRKLNKAHQNLTEKQNENNDQIQLENSNTENLESKTENILKDVNEMDEVELWNELPKDSLAPLASFVWNKDPNRFKPDSNETKVLAERLQENYPLLATLVKGEIPHPPNPAANQEPPESKWRSPLYTSKYDLELHDLIQSHFPEYDFSKIFTREYGKKSGQPPFPHFDHPDLITTPSEPPYVYYVMSMLPVSAFQQASDDNIPEAQFKDLCFKCMREAILNKNIRLSALTFIELTDMKFGTDMAVDYRLVVTIFDHLCKHGASLSSSFNHIINNINNISNAINHSLSNNANHNGFNTSNTSNNSGFISNFSNNSLSGNEVIIEELSKVFVQKCKDSARSLQHKIQPHNIEEYLICALLGVRCNLPIDYSPINEFASRGKPAELLLYIDRAEEIGAKYSLDEVVRIINAMMPENALKEHLLFHLTHLLPSDDTSVASEVQPALVVFRALRRTDQPQYVSLLQEAMMRKERLYALLATSVEGSDMTTCALVTLMTMTDAFSFDVANPPEKSQMARLFLQVVLRLLLDKKSNEVISALKLFSEESIMTQLSIWYHSVEIFAFRQAQVALEKINKYLERNNKSNINANECDDLLLGSIDNEEINHIIFPLQDALAKHCAQRSQVHLFRYLQLLRNSETSSFLKSRVKLCEVVEKFDNFRKSLLSCDLLGDFDKIVTDFVLFHSLALGQAAANCLEISSTTATRQWLRNQYSSATCPQQLLEIHEQISDQITDVDPLFFVFLYAATLPFTQPTTTIDLLKFASNKLKENKNKVNGNDNSQKIADQIEKDIDSLILHLTLCKENNIDAYQQPSTHPPIKEIIKILFPNIDPDLIVNEESSMNINNNVNNNNNILKFTSPILYSQSTIKTFFEIFVDRTIDICLDNRQINDARMLCEWRGKNPNSIILLEAVQNLLSCENQENGQITDQHADLLGKYGSLSNKQELLDNIAKGNGWRFQLVALHYRAANIIGLKIDHNFMTIQTVEFLKTKLPLMKNQLNLVRELIKVGRITETETAQYLVESFKTHLLLNSTINSNENQSSKNSEDLLNIDDYGDDFIEFVSLCEKPHLVGENLLNLAKNNHQNTSKNESNKVCQSELSISALTSTVLHASLCTNDVDSCAEKLDSYLDKLIHEKQHDLIIRVVSIFPDPSIIPRYFQYLIKQQKLDDLPHEKLSSKVGKVIINCARHVNPFEPEKYFDLTLNYQLFREHAELQMESGHRLLVGNPDKQTLQESSRHYLLALAYFLHEKCYSLSMECLKKLSLISLQLEVSDPLVLHLNADEVRELMRTKEFPLTLTLAVSYDMDNEESWSDSLFAQIIKKQGDEYLTAFQYFRPITTNLCNGIVKRYKDLCAQGQADENMKERMQHFLLNIPNLVERYRIAKELDFQDQIDNMKEVNPVVCEWCEKVFLNNH